MSSTVRRHLQLGAFHWHVLKAANALEKRGHRLVETSGGFGRPELTDLGKEVGRDEINWWLTRKETNVEDLRTRTAAVLDAVQTMKKAFDALKKNDPPESYQGLLSSLREFATGHTAEIERLYEYVVWLEKRHELAPTILYTYRIWGSTRASDRWIEINENDAITPEVTKILAETVLGLRLRNLCTYDRVHLQIGQDIYDAMSPEEQADGAKPVEVPSAYAIRRTAWETYDEGAIYFTEIRDSLRNIVLDIEKLSEQQALIHNVSFWRDFITKAAQSKMAEPQVWDFKETLSIWHAEGIGRAKARLDFVEDIAAFANARGGVLIVGVTDDKRRIVGVGSGKDLENRLQFAKTVILEQLVYGRDIATFKQIEVEAGDASKLCLVIVVAQACEVVGVNDGKGSFTYPVRLETGNDRSSQIEIGSKKIHLKSENLDFLGERSVRSRSLMLAARSTSSKLTSGPVSPLCECRFLTSVWPVLPSSLSALRRYIQSDELLILGEEDLVAAICRYPQFCVDLLFSTVRQLQTSLGKDLSPLMPTLIDAGYAPISSPPTVVMNVGGAIFGFVIQSLRSKTAPSRVAAIRAGLALFWSPGNHTLSAR